MLERVWRKRNPLELGLLVNKLFQALPPFFNKGLLKDPFVSSERELPLQGFPRQWWYYNLAISLQLIV